MVHGTSPSTIACLSFTLSSEGIRLELQPPLHRWIQMVPREVLWFTQSPHSKLVMRFPNLQPVLFTELRFPKSTSSVVYRTSDLPPYWCIRLRIHFLKCYIFLCFINTMVVGSFSNFSIKLCLPAPEGTRLCPLWKLDISSIMLSRKIYDLTHNILLLSLKASGKIKWSQLHNKTVALFQRQTEFKMLEITELLFFLQFQGIPTQWERINFVSSIVYSQQMPHILGK